MNCPNCTSSRIVSNKIDIIPDHIVPHGVHTARHAGHPAAALGLVTVWGITKGINALRHDWRCEHCDHRFSEK